MTRRAASRLRALLALAALLGTARTARALTGDGLCDASSPADTCLIVGIPPALADGTVLTFTRPNVEVRGSLSVAFAGHCSTDVGLPCASDGDCGPAPTFCERTGRLALHAKDEILIAGTGLIRTRGQAVAGDRIGPNGGSITLAAHEVTVAGVLDATAAGATGGIPGGRGGEIVLEADGTVTVETGARIDASSTGGCGGTITVDGPASVTADGRLLVEGASFGGAIHLTATDYMHVPGELSASNTGTLTTRPFCPDGVGGGEIEATAKRVLLTGPAKAEGRQAPGGRVRLEGERGITVDSTVGTPRISVTGGDRDGFFAGGGVFLVATAGDVTVRGGGVEANGVSTDFGSDAGVFQLNATGALRCGTGDTPCTSATDCAPDEACAEVGGNIVVEAALSAIGESGAGSGCFFDDGVRSYTCEIRGTGDVTVNAPVSVGGGRRPPAVGGKLIVAAGRSLTVGPGPLSSTAADGGEIVLIAGERAGGESGIAGVLHVVDGTVVRADARGDGGFGGRVEFDACTVELSATASVDVDAMTGGHSDGVEVTARNRLAIAALASVSAQPDGAITLAYRGEADVSPDATFQPPANLVQDPTIPACPACGNALTEPPEECDGPGTCPGPSEVCQDPGTANECTCRDTCGTVPGVQAGEECDGSDLDGQSCESFGFQGGTLVCRPDCTFDKSGCTADVCGDGIVGPTESCDRGGIDGAPPSFGDESCATRGFPDGGTLACTPDCDTIVGVPHCATTIGDTCTRDLDCPEGEGCVAGCIQCGNGFVDAGEECDDGDGNGSAPDHCRLDCRRPRCGDGTMDSGEDCDAGTAACSGGTNDGAPCCTDADCPGGACGGDSCTANRDDRPGCCRCDCGVAPPACTTCDDGNPCTRDECDPETGCHAVPVDDGTACADANVCNGDETCEDGACVAGTPLRCDDGDVCTVDTCASPAGCGHDPVGFPETMSALGASLVLVECDGERVPAAVNRLVARARTLVERASRAPTSRRADKLVRRSIRKLNLALSRIAKAERRGLRTACAFLLSEIVHQALDRAECLLGGARTALLPAIDGSTEASS